MGKTDVLKDHVSSDVLAFVAPLLETIAVINFIMELRNPFPDQDISPCEPEIGPLPPEMVEKPWTAVTTETSHLVVGGFFPGVNILLHVVTEATKRGAF